jgi:uncharacterized membrane protein YphA (DoxX/SURF4 family)
MKKKRMVIFFLRVAVGGIFFWAGVTKLVHPESFAVIVENYQVLPPLWVALVAVWLPWVELLCGLFLLIGIFVRGSALTTSVLMIIFMIMQMANLIRGLDVSCGCFSVSPEVKTSATLNFFRDLPILIGTVWLFFMALTPIADERRDAAADPLHHRN